MKLLLKILLQRRARDEGFTLPIVIALGLIMILLGAVNILSAGEENLLAISDNQKNKALAIAEVGVARYRQLLDNNRMLTVYDSVDWTSVANTCDINATISNFAVPTDWKQVNDGTGNIGQYRIVSYIYDIDGNRATDNNGQFAPNDDNPNTTDLITFNDNANYNPRGILTIKSRDTSSTTNVSEAQVQVEIPIRINRNDMTNLSPALWIGDRNITSPGSLTINDGNIVLSQPATGTTAGCTVPADVSGITPISDPRPLPTIISEPASSVINNLDDTTDITDNSRHDNFRGENNVSEPMLLLGATDATLHKVWRTVDGFDYFFYKTTSDLTIGDGEKVATDGQSRVILYVENDINLTNNASLQAGSKFTREYKSVGLQVYVNGTRNINIDPGGGTVRIKGLIHAPQSTVNITGSGTVRIEGAMWVKNWNNTGTANVTIIPDNAGVSSDKAYQHYLGTDNRAAKPITGAPTDWEVQEAAAN